MTGFQALSQGLSPAVRGGRPAKSSMEPCTANARRPTVDSHYRGTTISCCLADLRRCLPTTSVTGVQQSTRYCGASPCRHLCMMTPSLYVTRSATSSQCRSSCKIWVGLWSNFLVSLTTHANVGSDVIEPLPAQYDSGCCVQYVLQWPEMNCTDAMQDTVTIVDLAGDEGMNHGLGTY